MLLLAATRLDASPGRTAVCEDAVAGIEAAVRGGFATAIGVDRTDNATALRRAGADAVVRDLSELAWVPGQGLAVKTLGTLPLFAGEADEVRERLAGKTVAAFLDYDGTLTPIVEDHTKAFLPEDMRAAVAELAGSARSPS